MIDDYNRGRNPLIMFRIIALREEGYSLMDIHRMLELSYTTVHKYCTWWDTDRFGIPLADLKTAVRIYNKQKGYYERTAVTRTSECE